MYYTHRFLYMCYVLAAHTLHALHKHTQITHNEERERERESARERESLSFGKFFPPLGLHAIRTHTYTHTHALNQIEPISPPHTHTRSPLELHWSSIFRTLTKSPSSYPTRTGMVPLDPLRNSFVNGACLTSHAGRYPLKDNPLIQPPNEQATL